MTSADSPIVFIVDDDTRMRAAGRLAPRKRDFQRLWLRMGLGYARHTIHAGGAAVKALRDPETLKKTALNICGFPLRVHPCSISSRRKMLWSAFARKCLDA